MHEAASHGMARPSVARRQDDDWDSFNDRNSSLRLRFTGDNGAFDCAYSLHGKHPGSGTCSGPG